MNNLSFEIIKSLDTAQYYWDLLSPGESIFDEWDFRYCFYKKLNLPLFFYVGFTKNVPIGLLPLQYSTIDDCLEFFGGDYMEDNKIFIKYGYEKNIIDFYKSINQPAALIEISGDDPYTKSLPIDDYTYFYNLTNIAHTNQFIDNNFTGKSKKNLKHEMKKINENTIEIIKNNLNDLELMFKLNVNEFGENSWFESAHMQDVFCEILKLKYDIYLFTYLINGVKQGVSLSLKYKNRMLLLNYNSNKSNVPNLGKYIILHTMQNAIDEGSLYFDVGIGDCNWKEHWHFEKRALHKYYFNYKSSSENSFTISS